MKYITVFAVFLTLTGFQAEARNCKKGKPCGNSCISQKDVCHKEGGDSTQASTIKTEPTPAEAQASTTTEPVKAASANSVKHKDCKKGKPCGNSCIPEKATCHAS